MTKSYYIYILTNKNNSVLYTGMTGDLGRRMIEHRERINPKSFSARYKLNKLVYYEVYDNPIDALTREKQIKGGSRHKKIKLINSINKEWKDLFEEELDSDD